MIQSSLNSCTDLSYVPVTVIETEIEVHSMSRKGKVIQSLLNSCTYLSCVTVILIATTSLPLKESSGSIRELDLESWMY